MPETTTPRPWTYSHYLLLPDDGKRWEIIDGERFLTASPRWVHQQVLGELYAALHSWALEHGGTVCLSPLDVVLSEKDVVVPDLTFVSDERTAFIRESGIHGAPDLVVEILSDSTRKRDEVVKRDLYEAHGVREYWIVDAQLETAKVYRLVDGKYGAARLLVKGEALESVVLSGWSLALQMLFSD